MKTARRTLPKGYRLAQLAIVAIAGLVWRLFFHEGRAPIVSGPEATSIVKSADGHAYGDRYYYAGMPRPAGYPDPIKPLTNIGYVAGYDEKRKEPAWVCYALFSAKPQQALKRSTLEFEPDRRTRSRVESGMYSRTGYDRGHMAPNRAIALCYGQDAQRQTFLMSNIIPQLHTLNAGLWEHLEAREVQNYAPYLAAVWVVTGPVLGPKPHRLKSGIAIPVACYKILVDEYKGQPRMLAFIMPQTAPETDSLSKYLTSVDQVAKETGVDFFADLPDDLENQIEVQVAKQMW